MNNIFNKADNDTVIARINSITRDSKALWGKMNAAQMLYHCRQPILAGLGVISSKRKFIGYLFGGIAKKQMLSDKPFKKGLPTDKNFIPKGDIDFEKEKKELIRIVSSLPENGRDAISGGPHPFFGKLTTDEWNTLTWKHLDHHLSQFGV